MPITVRVTEGVLTEDAQKRVFAQITDAFLQHHGLLGNAFLAPNVIGEMAEIPPGRSFAAGVPAEIAIVELTVPSFALATLEQKQGFVADATDAIERASQGRLPRRRIWVNVTYAVDGLWGIGGEAYPNERLIDSAGAARG